MTTIGKYRHLSQCSNSDGHFIILAIDHRGNLFERLNQVSGRDLSDAELMTFKQKIIGQLSYLGSAVLADPAYGLGASIVNNTLNGQTGILAPIEVTDYDVHPSNRQMEYIADWSVAKLKRMGGDGVKLLLPYHPEGQYVNEMIGVVQSVIDQCTEHDIPFFLEPIPYSPDPEKHLTSTEFRDISIEMCGRFSKMGVDVLKLQFPIIPSQENDRNVWREAADDVDDACGDVPWALLSAGAGYETFVEQAQIACEAGASGIIVGRSIWQEAVELPVDERDEFLRTTARDRFQQLRDICTRSASAWWDRVKAPDASVDWYVNYGE